MGRDIHFGNIVLAGYDAATGYLADLDEAIFAEIRAAGMTSPTSRRSRL